MTKAELRQNKLSNQSIREWLKEKAQSAFVPSSVYRIQFSPKFNFRKAEQIIPYLKQLGIDTVYCSPYFQAAPGSTHGYDVVDPNKISSELGTVEDYERFCETLRVYGIKQILDVVPNHMGVHDNRIWLDVLENGKHSIFSHFFDIDWEPRKKELTHKVMIPILSDHYGRILENQEIKLSFSEEGFCIHYWEHRFPVAPESYPYILECSLEELKKELKDLKSVLSEYYRFVNIFRDLSLMTKQENFDINERHEKKQAAKKNFYVFVRSSPVLQSWIQSRVQLFNGEKGDAESFNLLDDLLDQQHYRMAFWRVASEEINYRRFFDINELAATRIEDPRVFEHYHQLLFKLIREEKVHGVRIDHPDGLYDPPTYFRRLQKRYLEQNIVSHGDELDRILSEKAFRCSAPLYVVAEKILDRKETLPEDWSVHGTVGYDFLNALNRVFVAADHEKAFDEIYEKFIGKQIDVDDLIYEKKKFFALIHMSSEINMLANRIDQISEKDRHHRDFTLNHFGVAIRELIASFPVYRTYISPESTQISERDRKYIRIAIEKAKTKTPALSHSVYDFLHDVMTLKILKEVSKEEALLYQDFVLRLQQLTGPIMAKGLEDTAFYIYNRLISLNEVGGDIKQFGVSIGEFHRLNKERSKHWPASFSPSSTHDTKRSEDVRMRINALSEMPEDWKNEAAKWAILNEKHKSLIDGILQPEPNMEYFFYQTLVGAWPLKPLNGRAYVRFRERIWKTMLKSIREAKVFTRWANPSQEYEDAVKEFVTKVLSEGRNNSFLKIFLPFQKRISRLGMLNSLSASVLKLTSPGVSDVYQGTEVWNYRLVDPDNRVTADFESLQKCGDYLQTASNITDDLSSVIFSWMKTPIDGRVKLWVLRQGLQFRHKHPELFLKADYLPLRVVGKKEQHVIAFARKRGKKRFITIATRFFSDLTEEKSLAFKKYIFQDTAVILPKDWKEMEMTNLLTKQKVKHVKWKGQKKIYLADVLTALPAAILTNVE